MRAVTALAILGTLAACKGDPQPPPAAETPKGPDFASAFKHSVRWDAEKNAAVIEMTIAPGYHAYTTGETTGKPLLVEIAAESDLALAGEVEYPKGIAKDLPLGRSVIVEGSAQIVAPLSPKDAAKAGGKAKGSLRYQVCTDEACDRPRTAPFELNAS
jgi:hypothetical protein